ncbi:MAG: RNA polymerase sigma factor [Phycisphaerae bacterium]|nr:RNA polymerase sigma factor [Phycisphaerae bacterium]
MAETSPSEARSDESLMLDFLDGSREAFEALVSRYRIELHQFLSRFLNSSAAADDVFQEAFLQVFQSGHTFDAARRFRPWLFTIAANKARDWHRRHRNRGALSLDAPVGVEQRSATLVDLLAGPQEAPGEPMERDEEARIVKVVVDELPANLREILLLAYFQRMSYGQIADALGIPLGTVKSRLHSAVAAFAARWRERSERGRAASESTTPNHGSDE